jgi:hypothetical protein
MESIMRVDIRNYDLHITSTNHQQRLVFIDDEGRIWTAKKVHHHYGEAKARLNWLINRGWIADDEWDVEVPKDSPAWVLDEIEEELEV